MPAPGGDWGGSNRCISGSGGARDLFAKAFSLNHRDTDIILSYAEFVSDPASKSILLDNVARLASFDRPERAAHAVARLRDPTAVCKDVRRGGWRARMWRYRLALSGFRPNGTALAGVLVDGTDQRRQAAAVGARYGCAGYRDRFRDGEKTGPGNHRGFPPGQVSAMPGRANRGSRWRVRSRLATWHSKIAWWRWPDKI